MMMIALAARNLSRHRRRTWVTLAALVLGVAAAVGARGFINAQHALMLEGTIAGQLGALQVHRQGFVGAIERSSLSYAFEDTPSLRARLSAVPGVVAVAPRIHFGALLVNAEGVPSATSSSSWLTATGIEPAAEREVTPRRFALVGAGRALEPADERAVWLQAELARGLGQSPLPPQPDQELWPALLANDADGAANGEAVQVVGTLLSSMPGDRRVALVPLRTAQRLLRLEGRVTEYAVAIDDLRRLGEVADGLRAALGPDFEVHRWDQLNPLLKELHGYQDLVFGFISGLLLAVVLLTAVNNMLMNVLERTREIGTLLAMGLRRRQISQLFVLEGALLGLLGGVGGAALGWAAVEVLNRLGLSLALAGTQVQSRLEFQVAPAFLLLVAALTCLSTMLSALWPARQASALAPVVALRRA